MNASYIITFVGADRPGLVEEVARVIEELGGNWHESRLSQLGGMFAGMVLVSLPADAEGRLNASLDALGATGLEVRLTAGTQAKADAPGRDIRLSVMGPDRPGIVREISTALARRQINVLEMDSAVAPAPMSAELMFSACINARIPEQTDMDDLSEALDEIANQMTLEIDLERTGA